MLELGICLSAVDKCAVLEEHSLVTMYIFIRCLKTRCVCCSRSLKYMNTICIKFNMMIGVQQINALQKMLGSKQPSLCHFCWVKKDEPGAGLF